MSGQQGDDLITRQERREHRLEKKKEKMPQHGRGLARVYKQAIEKRVAQPGKEKDTGKADRR